MITAYVLMCLLVVFNHKLRIYRLRRFQPCLFSSPEIFIPSAWYEKRAPKTGARKWSRFMAPVSGACVMSISIPLIRPLTTSVYMRNITTKAWTLATLLVIRVRLEISRFYDLGKRQANWHRRAFHIHPLTAM